MAKVVDNSVLTVADLDVMMAVKVEQKEDAEKLAQADAEVDVLEHVQKPALDVAQIVKEQMGHLGAHAAMTAQKAVK